MTNKTFRQINWLNLGLEFFVVLMGILLAFQLNQWSESRKQQALVNEHLQSLLDETIFNRDMLQAHIAKLEKELSVSEAFLVQQFDGDNAAQLNDMLVTLLATDAVYLKTNAYTSLIDTGDVRFINDFQLKNNIVRLYEYFRWLQGIDNSDFEFKRAYLMPFAMQQLDVVELAPQSVGVYQSKKARNIVGSMKYLLEVRLNKYQECLAYTTIMVTTLTASVP